MGTLVRASGHLFNAQFSGGLNREDLDYLETQIRDNTSRLGRLGESIRDRAMAIYERYDIDSVRRGLRAIERKASTYFDNLESIREFLNIGQLQNVGLENQRWLMANPYYRNLVHKERAEGWQDTYVDCQPDAIGHRHLDYQRVMQGMPIVEGEDLMFVTYQDIIEEEPMDVEVQNIHLRNWELLEYFARKGEDDPGSPSNASL